MSVKDKARDSLVHPIEQRVGTIVHVSCRDRNRLGLQAALMGAAAGATVAGAVTGVVVFRLLRGGGKDDSDGRGSD